MRLGHRQALESTSVIGLRQAALRVGAMGNVADRERRLHV
jgi:hypothetical protein